MEIKKAAFHGSSFAGSAAALPHGSVPRERSHENSSVKIKGRLLEVATCSFFRNGAQHEVRRYRYAAFVVLIAQDSSPQIFNSLRQSDESYFVRPARLSMQGSSASAPAPFTIPALHCLDMVTDDITHPLSQ